MEDVDVEKNEESDLIVGLEMNVVKDLYEAAVNAKQEGYNFLVTYIVHPQLKGELYSGQSRGHHSRFLARSEDSIATNDWPILVAAKSSQWINVDSPISTVRINSEKALDNELEYCYYLGIEVVVVPLRNRNCINLARHLLKKTPSIDHRALQCVWVHVPMTDPEDDCNLFLNDLPTDLTQVDAAECTWEWWNTVQTITNGHKVYLALEITSHLTELNASRWCTEPIHALMIDTSLFKTDKNGFPILSPVLQVFVQNVLYLNDHVRIVVRGNNLHGDMKLYRQHLVHLFKTSNFPDIINLFGVGNIEKLQLPIQPLLDILDIYSYEVLENDIVKYSEYGGAIKQALADTLCGEEKEERTLNILIIAAGRGALVDILLKAAAEVNRKIKITLHEKNRNVIASLYVQQQLVWENKVTIAEPDPESWDVSDKFDIIILEFVGAVVDKELLPESLGRAKKFLKEGGVMIPSSCTMYAAPVCAPKFHSAVCQLNKCYETPYAVMFPHRTTMAHPLPLFTFSYTNDEELVDYNLYSTLKFKAHCNYVLHGFLSFFEAVLYKDKKLSVHPDDYLEGFYSWMPLYFPFRVPMYVEENDEVELHFWRCVADTSNWIWYEWGLSQPHATSIHNPDGGSHKMSTEKCIF